MNRREFLRAAVATAAASASDALGFPRSSSEVKVNRIDLFPVLYPTKGYFKFFTGARGAAGRPAVIIKMTAEDGTVGWGQSVPLSTWSEETLETAMAALRDYFVPALIGRSPLDIAGAHAAMDKALAPGFSTGMPITRAGLDLALHDLAGKILGKSIAQLWGRPAGGPVLLSWTVNVSKIDEAASVVEAGKKRGYRHFNIKVAPDPDFDAALAREVRRLAPKTFLWADANGGYDLDTALKAAPMLADAGVDVLEAPFRPNLISAYQTLRKQGALPIVMDEGVVALTDLEEFAKLGMLDGLAIKHSRCGGLAPARSQVEFCRDRPLMWLGSGLTDPDISLAAALALYSTYGLKKPAALNGPQFLAADVLRKPLRIENGWAYVPQGPGLGVEVDESKVFTLTKKSGVRP
jgi:L-alanine-DL-glutamate epimerase-like enolase superfamily enzyme